MKRKHPDSTRTSKPRLLQAKLSLGPSTYTVAASMTKIDCPICSSSVLADIINMHIDTCIKRAAERENSSASKESSSLSSPLVSLERSEEIEGLYFLRDFVSDEEAKSIIDQLDAHETPWKHSSFNGHCMSKVYGVRTQFGLPGEMRCVRANKTDQGELNIPEFLLPYQERFVRILSELKDVPSVLKTFKPNECNANSYLSSQGHFLTPHFDDRALSGPVLMNLSLGCDSFMTYHSLDGLQIDIFLPANTLQLVTGKSRFEFKHSIAAEKISGPRRVSLTWRQAGISRNGFSQVMGASASNGYISFESK